MHKKFFFGRLILATALLVFAAAPSVDAVNIVYPGDPNWQFDSRASAGSAIISGNEPRSGNGSLALQTAGSLDDWAFFSRYASDNWGYLKDIQSLSFDWFRQTAIDAAYVAYDPWNLQSPVLRLLIKDQNPDGHMLLSELVWEKYYTYDGGAMEISTWVSQDVLGQNLWRHTTGIGYTISDGRDMDPFGTHTLFTATVGQWASAPSGTLALAYTDQAVVYGLSVGVGSNWPGPYTGYVDNVLLSFNNANGTVIDDNFEMPVPEPAALLLWAAAMTLLGVRYAWHTPQKQV